MGANFHTDEDFAESYKLYEKRRELLKKKKSTDRAINKEDLIKKLKEKKIASLDNEPNDMEACIVDDEESAMINQHGINIARLKGAVFSRSRASFPSMKASSMKVNNKKGRKLLQHEKKKFLL